MNVIERIVFHGRVQGVGFRHTARQLAQRHPVTGFVRNLPDRTVELVAHGAPAAIESLVGEIKSHFGDHISDVHREPHETTERFETFDVRF